MDQLKIIPEVKRLCIAGEYAKAIRLARTIYVDSIAIKAELLCIEHQKSRSNDNDPRTN